MYRKLIAAGAMTGLAACATPAPNYNPVLPYDPATSPVGELMVFEDTLPERALAWDAPVDTSSVAYQTAPPGVSPGAHAAGGLIAVLVIAAVDASIDANRNGRLNEFLEDSGFDAEGVFNAALTQELESAGFSLSRNDRAREDGEVFAQAGEGSADAVIDVEVVNYGLSMTGMNSWTPMVTANVTVTAAGTGEVLVDDTLRYVGRSAGRRHAALWRAQRGRRLCPDLAGGRFGHRAARSALRLHRRGRVFRRRRRGRSRLAHLRARTDGPRRGRSDAQRNRALNGARRGHRTMKHQIAAAALSAAALAACATPTPPPPPEPVAEFNPAACGETIALDRAQTLDPLEPAADFTAYADMNGESPCLIDADGFATPYAVIALPQAANTASIAVGGLIGPARVFPPRVDVLDADLNVQRTLPAEDFRLRGSAYAAMFRPRPGETHMLITADPALIGETLARNAYDPAHPDGTLNIKPGGTGFSFEGSVFARAYFFAPQGED